MTEAYAVADVRAAEDRRLAEVPEGALMQRAAAAVAVACARVLVEERGLVTGSRVVLLVGAGNNGGDALWAGARLARRGVAVTAVLTAPTAHGEGLAAVRAAGGRVVDAHGGESAASTAVVREADLVVDGLVGLGAAPGLREPAASLVAGIPDRVPVVAVDLPSGVDPDTGLTPLPHVRARVTVTFGVAKPCLLLPPAARAAGRVELVDIGLGPHLAARRPAVRRLWDADVAERWPWPVPEDDKYRRGVVGVVAGSTPYPGAAVLACAGALRSGAGMVRYLGPDRVGDRVRSRWPEVVGAGRVQAYVLGCGVDPAPDATGAGPTQRDRVAEALVTGLPCVVDAGAVEILADLLQDGVPVPAGELLLTPHAGELARLLTRWDPAVSRAQVEADPLRHALRAAGLTGATVLLKGAITLVVTPDGAVTSQADAPAWLATAGAGDVLAGIAGTLLAAGLRPPEAGAVAAFVHGRAAQHASGCGPVLAGDVADAVPAVIAALRDWER